MSLLVSLWTAAISYHMLCLDLTYLILFAYLGFHVFPSFLHIPGHIGSFSATEGGPMSCVEGRDVQRTHHKVCAGVLGECRGEGI